MNETTAAKPTLTAADDGFHPPGDDRLATETAWFSFFVPERGLGGWLYTRAMPNLGLCQGGAWVWDRSGHLPWEVPYYAYLTCAELDPDSDLRDFSGGHGVRIRAVEPLRSYEVGYQGRGGRLVADLRFEALHAPHVVAHGEPPFTAAHHFDQLGRVTGEVRLNGEMLEVDCVTMRDRSWGPRSERKTLRMGYAWAGDHETGFLAYSEDESRDGGTSTVTRGYLWQDGALTRLAGGRRVDTRDEHGLLQTIELVMVDASGRETTARGTVVSRLALPHAVRTTWTSLVEWDTGSGRGPVWGEDQDVWMHDAWRARFPGPSYGT